MVREKDALSLLAELEELALRDLRQQAERLRAALDRYAPVRNDSVEHGELGRTRMSVTDSLELWVHAHGARRRAQQEQQEAGLDG